MKKYSRNNITISSKLNDEQIILDIEKGKYFSLNPVATHIWELLEEPMELDDLCSKLISDYEVDAEQCKADTNNYIKDLIRLGLILEYDK